MATNPDGERVVQSVLDRLCDEEEGEGADQSHARGVEYLKRAVARDLEFLLNTRCGSLGQPASGYAEASRSVLAYGLPDFGSFAVRHESDRERLRGLIEQAIETFETRLEDVRVIFAPTADSQNSLVLRLEAKLRVRYRTHVIGFDIQVPVDGSKRHVREVG